MLKYKVITTHQIEGQCPVTLEQEEGSPLIFRVTYGIQLFEELQYLQAATHFGACVLHAATCAGRVKQLSCKLPCKPCE